ncbi:hypothetical protein ACOMHN_005310 [Nucella lapillus]
MFGVDGAGAAAGNSSSVVSGGDDGEGGTTEKGMRPFFDMVKSFLGVVQPERITDQPWLNLSNIIQNGRVQGDEINDWKNWCKYLVGFLVCAGVGLLFFIVMPIVGLFFCCCRCCGKCGARPKPQDTKYSRCKRISFCTVLVVLNTVALAGVVCTFMSNQILYDKMQNVDNRGPVGKLIRSADYINTFTNTTINEVTDAVLGSFLKTSASIISDIRSSAVKAIDTVLRTLQAQTFLDKAKRLSDDVAKTQAELKKTAIQLAFLSSKGAELTANLTEIRTEIDSVCNPTTCPGYDPNAYSISADFSGLDSLRNETENVAKAANLSQFITQAEKTIEDTKTAATSSVESGINSSTASINNLEVRIRDALDKITSELQGSVTTQLDGFRSDLSGSQDDISKYSKYVWYAGLGISCALLLIVLLYYIGILFGLCGERPGFGAQCCNTGTGSSFLMAGVGFTFLLTWLIMLVCTILFMLGGPLYTELCRYFDNHNPKDLKPFNDALMNAVDFQRSLFNGKDVELDLVNILKGCENNEAIYSVLQLDNMVNISQYTDLSQVRTALDDLKSRNFNIPDVDLLNPAMRQSISDFANAGLDGIPFDSYTAQVNKNVTVGNLPELAAQLRTMANKPGLPQNAQDTLNNASARLDDLQTNTVIPMQNAKTLLGNSVALVKQQADSGLQNSTNALIDGLNASQNAFNTNKTLLVDQQVNQLVGRVLDKTESVVQVMLNDVNHNIGKCRPVFDSFYSATDAACVVALEPLNGIWFGIGWCLFFFIPALIFAVKLAGLYRREHEERDFDDPRQQPGRASPSRGQQGRDGGAANAGFQEENAMSDYPHYKGGADNHAYHPDGHTPDSKIQQPPPYGAGYPPPDGRGAMNGNGRGRDYRQGSDFGVKKKLRVLKDLNPVSLTFSAQNSRPYCRPYIPPSDPGTMNVVMVTAVFLLSAWSLAVGVTYNLVKGDTCSSCCRGMPGPQGVPGLPGLHGARGGQGGHGLKGDRGDKGLPGDKGNAGVPGEMGVKGRRGRKAQKGECGPAGPVGPKGKDGSQGKVGGQGPKGSKGDKGPHPARVAFTVSRSGPLGPVVQKTPVIFDTIHTNLGDSFDVYSSHFICKVNGTYLFTVHVLSAENQTAYGWIMLNNDHQLAFHGDGRARHGTGSNTLILRLGWDDHVWVQLNEKSSLLNHFSSFSGHLLFED